LGDLLVLLTGYNNCSALEPVSNCGDPVSYQGYDYGTVEVGVQCWFEENLRVEAFRNGDPIPTSLDDAAWTSTSDPARTTYGTGTSNCTSTMEAFDACDESAALAAFGRLYNWHAVTDDRHLCPEGWHVPSDAEWMALEMHLGMSESDAQGVAFRGTDQGTQLKAVEGWSAGGNGTDDHGFAALPHGYRYTTGAYFFAGTLNFYWSSTASDNGMAWYRALLNSSPKVSRNKSDPRNGYGVRCLRDDV
jgi:uncharacterized protein (TIGR02145 family)